MSHPGIATREHVVATWLRENQAPPDVRAVLESFVRAGYIRRVAELCEALDAQSLPRIIAARQALRDEHPVQESAPQPGAAVVHPPSSAAPLDGGDADTFLIKCVDPACNLAGVHAWHAPGCEPDGAIVIDLAAALERQDGR